MLNKLKIITFWSVFFLEFDLGVRKGVQFWFGGMLRGSVSIWGYGDTKRLRAAALKSNFTTLLLYMFSLSYELHHLCTVLQIFYQLFYSSFYQLFTAHFNMNIAYFGKRKKRIKKFNMKLWRRHQSVLCFPMSH
jgi:hypothetical protein